MNWHAFLTIVFQVCIVFGVIFVFAAVVTAVVQSEKRKKDK